LSRSLVIFDQALRLQDNPALYHAAKQGEIVAAFVYDPEVQWPLGGASKWWLHHSLAALKADLAAQGITLILRRGDWLQSMLQLVKESAVSTVFWNRCYEPHNISKYKTLKSKLAENNIQTNSYNGSLLFEPWTVLNQQDHYFKVFTPFWNCCLKKGGIEAVHERPALRPAQVKLRSDALEDWKLLPSHPDWSGGLKEMWQPGEKGAHKNLAAFIRHKLAHYTAGRDIPADSMTSCLSPHLHWGEISPRQIWHVVRQHEMAGGNSRAAEKFLSELGWREFSYYLLYHFPELPQKPFNGRFAGFPWAEETRGLRAWQRGQTGYPIVDAGMRELWHTGYMHNRVRMIVASFLTKDLRIAWQEGAKWFWDTLVDADLANNSASWQWVAGCGADASPYFRVFNPVLQGTKFDPQGKYVRRWVPELSRLADTYIHSPWQAKDDVLAKAHVVLGKTYPRPIVDHSIAREEALRAYKEIKAI